MPPKRMTANPVRPARYRPGKPIAPEDNSDSDSDSEPNSESELETTAPKPAPKPASASAPKLAENTNLKSVDLEARFSEAQRAEEARIKAKEKAAAAAAAERDAAKENSEDEYTTDESEESEEESEEEEAPRRTLLRPTFIPKSKRGNAVKPDEEAEEKKKAEEEEREREEAETLLEERLKRDAIARQAGRKEWDDDAEEGEGVDDTDDLDPVAERAAWKLRELLRVKRERDALEQIEKEREEIERRREMDPELRQKEDMEFVAEQRKKKMEERGQMGFMQKFYHKGAFYQDDSEVLKRNYATAPVEDSAKNRDVLPKYMQVRGDEVGKRGRTKWTHLTAEDTSLQSGGSPWFDNKKKDRFGGGPPGDDRFRPDTKNDRHGEFQSGAGGRGGRDAGERHGADRSRRENWEHGHGEPGREHRKRSSSPKGSHHPAEKRRRWDQ